MSEAMLRELVDETRAMRQAIERLAAAVERQAPRRADDADGALLEAVEGFFGPAPFTAGGLLLAGAESRELADALGEVIDLNAEPHAQAVALGTRLARLPGLEACGGRRGARLYRVAASLRD